MPTFTRSHFGCGQAPSCWWQLPQSPPLWSLLQWHEWTEHLRAVFPQTKICYFLPHCRNSGPPTLVKTAHSSPNSGFQSSTVCLNTHPVPHLASACPCVPEAANAQSKLSFVFNIHLGISVTNHLQKLTTETLIIKYLQCTPTTPLPAETCRVSQVFTTTPSLSLNQPRCCQRSLIVNVHWISSKWYTDMQISQLRLLQSIAGFASAASPLFELGPGPENPYACVYFSNKMFHMQVSAQPVLQCNTASFQHH